MNKRSALSVSPLIGTTGALAVAVVLAVAATDGTYALWRVSEPVPGAVITAGSAALSLTNPSRIQAQELYPGQSVTGEFTVSNTGTVPLELQVDALTWPAAGASTVQQALAGSLTVSIWADAGAGCATIPDAPAWSGSFTSSPGTLDVTLDSQARQNMCLAAELATDAPSAAQGGSLNVHLTLGGVQQ